MVFLCAEGGDGGGGTTLGTRSFVRRPSDDVIGVRHGGAAGGPAAALHHPVLIGHSLGGVVATWYAARYPARAVLNLDQPLLAAVPGVRGALAGVSVNGPL